MRSGNPSPLVPPVENRFKPGQSGNPGGKPKGARNRLQGSFVNALAEDFERDGKSAIVKCRETDPSRYLTIVASLMPKQTEMEINRPFEDLTNEQLDAAIALLKSHGIVVAEVNDAEH